MKRVIKASVDQPIYPRPNGYHNIWDITDIIGVHNDGGIYHVYDRSNGNNYLFTTENLDELNSYLKTNYGVTIADPDPIIRKEPEPKKRYPLYFWNMLETAVNNMTTIPDEQKEEFVTLVGDRAVPKKVPGYGYKSSKLPVGIIRKYDILPYVSYYAEFLRFDQKGLNSQDLTIEEALQEIYDAMKNKWFPASSK